MTDNTNVSYSFQIGASTQPTNPAPLTETDPRTFAYADCEQVIINDKTMMIINLRNRNKMVVTLDVANALTHCANFDSLAAHTARLCATIPMLREQQSDVLQVLKAARDAGILVSSNETAARLNTAPTETRVAPTRVFIITCDRPLAIERLLDSMLAGCTLTRHDQLILIDDSRRASNALHNQQLVAKFNLTSAKSMLYFGAEAAASLLTQLVEALPAQARGLHFLLDRARWTDQATYGLSRNLALLLSVGYRAIVLDDDILCRAVRPPTTQPGVAFSNEETREAWFYPAERELLQHSTWCDFDPLSRQAEALGKPLAAVLSTLHGGALDPAALEHCNGNLLGVFDSASCVLVTQCGSAGDPGTAGSTWVLNLGDPSITRLLSANADSRALPENRFCWLGHTRPTVSLRGDMSQMTGLDNSHLLPPYAPIMRGEDDLFACMTAYLHPRSAVFHCDWAVPHLPLDDRADRKVSRPFTPQIGLGTLSCHLRAKIDTRNNASAESRLAALAAEIRGLGECSADTLFALCDIGLANDCAAILRALEPHLEESRTLSHPAWQSFLKKNSAEAQAALTSASAFDSGHPPHWITAAQEAAIALAEALEAWPVIRNRSAMLTADMIASGDLLPA